jgi:hypothetical protein
LSERITDGPVKPGVLFGVNVSGDVGSQTVLQDWQVLKKLNEMPWRKEVLREASTPENANAVLPILERSEAELTNQINDLAPSFSIPECRIMAILWPRK